MIYHQQPYPPSLDILELADDGATCRARPASDPKWACTRVRGHDGCHEACGVSRRVFVEWGDGE